MSSEQPLPIPKTSKEITKDWIIQATNLTPIDGTISTIGNVQEGVGFLSNLCRVSFQTESGTESILVKLLPDKPEYLELTLDENFNKREVQFYSLVYPELLRVSPILRDNLCKYYSSRHIDGGVETCASMLVIEDLKPLGYSMLNPESPRWKENLEKVVNFLAIFHATSLTLENLKGKKIPELFPFCLYAKEGETSGQLLNWGVNNAIRLNDFLKKYDYPEEMLQAYQKLSENIEPILRKVILAGSYHPCLIHFDIWHPNIMVNESDNNLKIIDWQTLAYKDPAYELSVAILTCLPRGELNRSNINHFVKLYFDLFTKACKDNLIDYDRSEEEFMEFFHKWGIAHSLYWWLLSLDSFPNDPDRLCKAFEFLHNEYKMPQLLVNDLK